MSTDPATLVSSRVTVRSTVCVPLFPSAVDVPPEMPNVITGAALTVQVRAKLYGFSSASLLANEIVPDAAASLVASHWTSKLSLAPAAMLDGKAPDKLKSPVKLGVLSVSAAVPALLSMVSVLVIGVPTVVVPMSTDPVPSGIEVAPSNTSISGAGAALTTRSSDPAVPDVLKPLVVALTVEVVLL